MPSVLGCFKRRLVLVTICDVIDPTMELGVHSRAREIPSVVLPWKRLAFRGFWPHIEVAKLRRPAFVVCGFAFERKLPNTFYPLKVNLVFG